MLIFYKIILELGKIYGIFYFSKMWFLEGFLCLNFILEPFDLNHLNIRTLIVIKCIVLDILLCLMYSVCFLHSFSNAINSIFTYN